MSRSILQVRPPPVLCSIQYGAAYERQKFASSTADAVTMLSVVMGTLVALDAAVPMARTGFHGLEIVYALVHLWSREHAEAKVSFFGIISMPGAYLSWAFLVIDLVQGQGFIQPLLGILAGHTYGGEGLRNLLHRRSRSSIAPESPRDAMLGRCIPTAAAPPSPTPCHPSLLACRYFFLTDVYPTVTGKRLIRTPRWLCVFWGTRDVQRGVVMKRRRLSRLAHAPLPPCRARLMLRHSVGRVPVAQTEPVHPSSNTFRAFSGKGQKLQ